MNNNNNNNNNEENDQTDKLASNKGLRYKESNEKVISGPFIRDTLFQDVTIATEDDIKRLDEAIKTLEVKFEMLSLSFNDYVKKTGESIKVFLDEHQKSMDDYIKKHGSVNGLDIDVSNDGVTIKKDGKEVAKL